MTPVKATLDGKACERFRTDSGRTGLRWLRLGTSLAFAARLSDVRIFSNAADGEHISHEAETGERRFERAVQEATLPQQTDGHSKTPEERKSAEIREMTAARHQLSPMSPVKVFPAKANTPRRVATSAQSD
jgi:hypothetical protein